jgi:hypothetical protein
MLLRLGLEVRNAIDDEHLGGVALRGGVEAGAVGSC